jgi:hypothetical protein
MPLAGSYQKIGRVPVRKKKGKLLRKKAAMFPIGPLMLFTFAPMGGKIKVFFKIFFRTLLQSQADEQGVILIFSKQGNDEVKQERINLLCPLVSLHEQLK